MKTDSELWKEIAEIVEDEGYAFYRLGLCDIVHAITGQIWPQKERMRRQLHLMYSPRTRNENWPYWWPFDDRQSRVIAALLLSEITK